MTWGQIKKQRQSCHSDAVPSKISGLRSRQHNRETETTNGRLYLICSYIATSRLSSNTDASYGAVYSTALIRQLVPCSGHTSAYSNGYEVKVYRCLVCYSVIRVTVGLWDFPLAGAHSHPVRTCLCIYCMRIYHIQSIKIPFKKIVATSCLYSLIGENTVCFAPLKMQKIKKDFLSKR